MARAEDFRGLSDEMVKMQRDRIDFVDAVQANTRKALKDIKSDISTIKKNTANLIADFNARDQERAKEVDDLQAAARSFVAECTGASKARASDVAKMIADLDAGDKQRAQEIANQLSEFNARDHERAKEVDDLQAAVHAFVAECTEASKARTSNVADMIAEHRKEREEAAVAWKYLLAAMATDARGGGITEAEVSEEEGLKEAMPGKPKAKAKPKKMKPAKAKKVEPEAKAKKAEPEEAKEESELSDKEEKILSIVNDNPEGISLPEIAYVMEVAYITITRDIKKLMTDGLIKKEDYLYFPA